MNTNLNDWLKMSVEFINGYQTVREVMVCTDGTTLSVQASSGHYCSPRESFINDQNEITYFDYSHVEVWCVSCDTPASWKEYGDQEESPYAYIPVSMVEEFIAEHGGYVESWNTEAKHV